MNELLLVGAGIAAALSPCPLATNMAAVGYMARQVGNGRASLLCALLYAVGRMGAYMLLGLVLQGGLVTLPPLSYWLQETLPLIMGPLLLLTGLVLTEALPLPAWLHNATPSRSTTDALLAEACGELCPWALSLRWRSARRAPPCSSALPCPWHLRRQHPHGWASPASGLALPCRSWQRGCSSLLAAPTPPACCIACPPCNAPCAGSRAAACFSSEPG